MVLAKHSAVAVAFTSLVVASLGATARAASVEVYPGPGVDTYRSSLYTVEVSDGSSWVPAYVYGYKRRSVTYWHPSDTASTFLYPSVNFLTFGTTGQVDVRVTRISATGRAAPPIRVGRSADSPRAIPTLRVGPLAAGSRRYSGAAGTGGAAARLVT